MWLGLVILSVQGDVRVKLGGGLKLLNVAER